MQVQAVTAWGLLLALVISVLEATTVHQNLVSTHPYSTEAKSSYFVDQTHTSKQREVTVSSKLLSQSPPTCLSLKGCACVADASGIDCPRRLEGSCPNVGDLCCNMTVPEIPNCYSVNGTCLFNQSMIKCPLKLDAYCPDVSYHCCNMTLPPLPQCSKLNGTCLYKNSHIACPSRLTAACPNLEDYCCNMTSQPPEEPQTCAERNGACIGDTWPFFCESRINASCPKHGYYCCKSGQTTEPNNYNEIRQAKTTLRQDKPPCSNFDASCIGDTWPYYCPPERRLNATCPQMFYCCGTNHSRSVDLSKSRDITRLLTTPTCSEVHGQCLHNASALHCPHVVNASCPDTRHYCCNLTAQLVITSKHKRNTGEEVILVEDIIKEGNNHDLVDGVMTENDRDEDITFTRFHPQLFKGLFDSILFYKQYYAFSDKISKNLFTANTSVEKSLIRYVKEDKGGTMPKCDVLKGGQCLFNNSRIYCPEKLEASCESPDNYCCKLN